MKYTEKQHAKNLINMLENSRSVEFQCPAAYRRTYDTCSICRNFISLSPLVKLCPCYALKCKKAIKRTWLALEEKGYLD